MGGVWERMIRTVRSVLHGICREQILSDECLNTYMYKVMGIVNSRPITMLSDDVRDDDNPLILNHLLHLNLLIFDQMDKRIFAQCTVK